MLRRCTLYAGYRDLCFLQFTQITAMDLLVLFSGEPRRTVVLMHCENWEPGTEKWLVDNSYTSIFTHDDDDIEYYEYEDGN